MRRTREDMRRTEGVQREYRGRTEGGQREDMRRTWRRAWEDMRWTEGGHAEDIRRTWRRDRAPRRPGTDHTPHSVEDITVFAKLPTEE